MSTSMSARILAAFAIVSSSTWAQAEESPVNAPLGNYETIAEWAQLPNGERLGASAAIEIDTDGKSVWVAERCGQNTCADTPDRNMVFKFDPGGKMVKSWGAGLLVTPHGMFVAQDGSVWITDMGVNAEKTKGQTVTKFNADGKVLLVLGTPGQAGAGMDKFNLPCDVVVGPDGSIYVSDSHGVQAGLNARISKFTKDGKFLKSWGQAGAGAGELSIPHAMAFDSRGRLFVADRGNNRIQIFDQDGKSLATWKQFSRPSGLYIRNDILYVSDSETNIANHPGGWRRGIRIGSVRDGKVTAFIPQKPTPNPDAEPSGMEGVAADAAGNIYGSNVYLRTYFVGGPWGEVTKFAPKH
jgi:DNA-binding beta-propeller fold protein YncE